MYVLHKLSSWNSRSRIKNLRASPDVIIFINFILDLIGSSLQRNISYGPCSVGTVSHCVSAPSPPNRIGSLSTSSQYLKVLEIPHGKLGLINIVLLNIQFSPQLLKYWKIKPCFPGRKLEEHWFMDMHSQRGNKHLKMEIIR